jgi:hypothetical protein
MAAMNKTLRGIGCLLAGMVTAAVPSIATDVILEKTGVFPSFAEQMEQGLHVWWMLLLALAYRLAYQALGAYVTAKLAPDRPMFWVLIGAAIGFGVCVIGAIVMWDKGSHWYPIALAILTPPTAWLGGTLATRSSSSAVPART